VIQVLSAMIGSGDERVLYTVFVTLVTSGVLLLGTVFYLLVDYMGWWKEKRLRPIEQYAPRAIMWRAVSEVSIEAFLVAPLLNYFIFYPLMKIYAKDDIFGPLPPWNELLLKLLIVALIEDTMFYWSHRLLHHRWVYKYIHKQHHEFKYTNALTTTFAHPIETIFTDIVPISIGVCLVKGNMAFACVAFTLRIWQAIDAHSGYVFDWSIWNMFPFQSSTARHDFHHTHNVGCFGSLFIFWDWFCGTDVRFLEYQDKKDSLTIKEKNIDSTKENLVTVGAGLARSKQ